MDHRAMQATACRLLTALRIAEANEGHNQGVYADAIAWARQYVADLDLALDKGRWRCARCGTEHPEHVGSCSPCQGEIVARP